MPFRVRRCIMKGRCSMAKAHMTCRPAIVLIVLALVFFVETGFCRAGHESAEILLRCGRIYTMDAARTWADSIACAGGRIIYVGSAAGAQRFCGPDTKIVDLEGKMVLPGFNDSHCHPVVGGVESGQCSLFAIATREEIYEAIRAYAGAHPEKKWISGSGWATPLFPGGSPTCDELDRIIADRPALLSSADGHSAWVNTRALKAASIDRRTPDPPGGHIERDAKTGEPSGTLRESAIGLVASYLPAVSKKERLLGLIKAQGMANSLGITAVQEANASDAILDAYREMDLRHELTLRVMASLRVDPARGEAQLEALVSKRARYEGDRLKARAAKLYIDGVMETHTAALLSPYLDRHGDRGRLLIEPEPLCRLVLALHKEGFQVHVHAIGDRAVRVTLDAFEAARSTGAHLDARHHIAHLELIDPLDIPRFRDLSVIANVQPLWAFPDTYITDMTEPILGRERSRWLYPMGSLARSGALLVAGSDWPVSSMNPLEAIQVAVTRQALQEPRLSPWIPEERLSLQDILAAYTIHGAYLSHEEHERGSLEEGKAADLVVIDRNLFAIKPEDIHKAKVLLTIVGGHVVYRDPSFQGL
jgi:predicted amidohydrolase YtcJ